MFDITAEDISDLSDAEARELVIRLSEADLRERGLSPGVVAGGGRQDEPDDGIDVKISLSADTPISGFIPRAATVFQVKKPDMQPGKIKSEMRPKGKLRAIIRDLAKQSGAYVIVNTGRSVTPAMLEKRRAAMKAASNDHGGVDLAIEFMDASAVAAWVRMHHGIGLWVRQRLGRDHSGWKPYGPWSYAPEGVNGIYIPDETARIISRKDQGNAMGVVKGINFIRQSLQHGGATVRLVGQSGVGKTRLAQALFDGRIGWNSLDPALAHYVDVGGSHAPAPEILAGNLVASRRRAILIVDNCGAEQHQRLTAAVRVKDSTVSVLSIEYDISDDSIEGTEVITIKPSSAGVIRTLLRHRFPDMSEVNIGVIANHAGGNARVAIALAGNIGADETIRGLDNEALFRRIFIQRNSEDDTLLRAAQAFSLVYSFKIDDAPVEEDLDRIGSLIGLNVDEMYRAATELRRRDLVQERGHWRALLPQAIANRLARQALQSIPPVRIKRALLRTSSDRLQKSFARRLYFLHDVPFATSMAQEWLGQNGFLGDLRNLDETGIEMFRSVAPVVPMLTLSALERAAAAPEGSQILARDQRLIRTIRHIAYDATLFARCCKLLISLIDLDKESEREFCRESLTSLFFMHLSGTHASAEQRLEILKPLLQSESEIRLKIGVRALQAMLEAWHFSSSFEFEFGARVRDTGLAPESVEDVRAWFRPVLQFVLDCVQEDKPERDIVLEAMSMKMRSIWERAEMCDEVERICQAVNDKGFWREGWHAFCKIVRTDSQNHESGLIARAITIRNMLAPKNLIQEIQGVVLADLMKAATIADGDLDAGAASAGRLDRVNQRVEILGRACAEDRAVLSALLPELLSCRGQQLYFGIGLGKATRNPRDVWKDMLQQLSVLPENKRQHMLFAGFLEGLGASNKPLVDDLLDESLQCPLLGQWYPWFQSFVGIDAAAVERLMRSLELGVADISTYESIRWPSENIDMGLSALLAAISARKGGYPVAFAILDTCLSLDKTGEGHAPEVINAGRMLLEGLSPEEAFDNADAFYAGRAAVVCLTSPNDAVIVKAICGRILKNYETTGLHPPDLWHLIAGMCKVQPVAVLDGLLNPVDGITQAGKNFLEEFVEDERNPVSIIPINTLLGWCNADPTSRYPAAARIVKALSRETNNEPFKWSPQALALLENAPDGESVLQLMTQQFIPSSWWGSRSSIIEERARLLEKLPSKMAHAVAKVRGGDRAKDSNRKREGELRS